MTRILDFPTSNENWFWLVSERTPAAYVLTRTNPIGRLSNTNPMVQVYFYDEDDETDYWEVELEHRGQVYEELTYMLEDATKLASALSDGLEANYREEEAER